jgi:hypothetical protein
MAARHTGGTLERPAYDVGFIDLDGESRADLSRWVPTWVRCAVRCTAHRTNGQPCRAWAVRGAQVCWSHGGASPQVRRAARRRLAIADWERSFARLVHRVAAWQEARDA